METVKSPHTNENQNSTYQNQEMVKVCEEDGGVKMSESFLVDRSCIESISQENQDVELQTLGLSVYNQETLELGIQEQVNKAFKLQEREVARKRLERELKSVVDEISTHEQQLWKNGNLIKAINDSTGFSQCASIKKSSEMCRKKLHSLRFKLHTLEEKQKLNLNRPQTQENQLHTSGYDSKGDDSVAELCILHTDDKESEIERRVRLGEMTPFGSVLEDQSNCISGTANELSAYEKYLLEQSKYQGKQRNESKPKLSSKCLKQNSFINSSHKKCLKKSILLPKKRRKKGKLGTFASDEFWDQIKSPGKLISEKTAMDEDVESEYIPSDDYSEDDEQPPRKRKLSSHRNVEKQRNKFVSLSEDWATDDSDWECSDDESRAKKRMRSKKEIDDGNADDYMDRLKLWKKNRVSEETDLDHELEGGYRIPKYLWNKLYNYQKVGVQWLWELNQQRSGGILGDEMGLGKTIQVISFLAGLSHSKLISRHGRYQGLGSVLIVCPTTVMHQWVKEFHVWWPQFRVAVLHESGSFSGRREVLIRNINKDNGILVTSYVGVVQHKDTLVTRQWHYVILDEGHKIRNPDAQVTLAVKMLCTPHRVILSGSPMQNSLKELWSLFDFVFPGKLGTLPVFLAQLAVPITQGGYSNASQVQVATAYRCATVLRDTISPYLLRRMKSDVKTHIQLPPKNEQVLFCRLTEEQRQYYKAYIDSGEVERILQGQTKIFLGLINLRKICNHPDLYSGGPKLFRGEDGNDVAEESRYGHWKKSGKMIVIESLLKIWKKQGHRVLLFTQSRQMLCIMEAFVQKREYKYLKLDGGTSIAARQPLITKFNQDTSYFIFLLTTRVGGLGVNLTGANRVVIYDPDWNPATDTQARERAWRIGQQNRVTVYRLVTAGTIEEKIYHRQIFKQFLTNKVLQDPKQRRFFKSNDLFELFTLKESDRDGSTETSAIFAGTGSEVKVNLLKSKRNEIKRKMNLTLEKDEIVFPQSKVERMKELAQKLSRKIGESLCNPGIRAISSCISRNLKSESCSLETVSVTTSVSNKALHNFEKFSKSTSENSVHDSSSNKKLMRAKLDSSKLSNSNDICLGKMQVTQKIKMKSKCKRQKQKKSKTIEGEKVPFLVRQCEAKVSTTQSEDDEVTSEQDDYVLKKLFKKSGLQTALRHDAIMEGGEADYVLVEGEAQRVAHEAVKALKESRRQCFRAGEGIPTWTGQHGNLKSNPGQLSRPRFGNKKKITTDSSIKSDNEASVGPSGIFCGKKLNLDTAMSSSELLSRIHARNRLLTAPPAKLEEESRQTPREDHRMTAGSYVTSSKPSEENVDLLADIRNFIAFGAVVDGRATTQEIIDKFKARLPQGSSPLFKFLLQEICEFHRMPSGDGIWKLRTEFKW